LLEWARKDLGPIDPIGRVIWSFYDANPSFTQRTIKNILAVRRALHPSLHSALGC